MVHLRRLMRVRTRDRVARVYVIESHVSLWVIIMRYSSIHCLHRKLRVRKLTSRWRLWTTHHVLMFLLNHLVAGAVIARYGWGLNSTDLASNFVPTMHHLIEYLLLRGVRIRLIFLTYWHILT